MVQPDEIIRSHRKTLSISIDPFGRLIVRAPKTCGKERIFAFLQEKENWILRKKAERSKAGIRLPEENLHGYGLLLQGEMYQIQLENRKNVFCDFTEKILFLPQDMAREKLVKWLKAQARLVFSELVEKYSKIMQTSYKKITVTSAKSRWGSCSFDNSLHFSYRLLYVEREVAEYVVVHELAHTKHKNHSVLFWSEVKKYVPDYKEKRKWLKIHSGLMEIF